MLLHHARQGWQSTLALVRQNIVKALYIYAEGVKQLIIWVKCRNFSVFKTSEISSADFSGIMQHTLVQRSHTANIGPVLLPLYNIRGYVHLHQSYLAYKNKVAGLIASIL